MRTYGGDTGESHQDVLLYRFYRLVARRHAARLGTGYDIAADAHRSGGWLDGRTLRPGEILQGPRGKHASIPGLRADRGADRTVAALYGQHYAGLVRLASLLVGDAAAGEEIVQDSFAALYASRRRLGDGERALSYLRQSVLHHSRSAARGHAAAEPRAPGRGTEGPAGPWRRSAAQGGSAVVSALRALPARQREAVVMRYYAGLSESRVAEVMGITRRAAGQHTERGMAALRAMLDTADDPGRLGAAGLGGLTGSPSTGHPPPGHGSTAAA
jgi:RNA polymerase sigma factor (sigma-70 family)